MKRYYSHYTFIYPDIYLRNSVVEVNNESQITNVSAFDIEIESTEFYSGLLLFIPVDTELSGEVEADIQNQIFSNTNTAPIPDKRYRMIHNEDFTIK
ncbi:hypothetical protein [Dysgonomonas sp. 521]|uniref:hypothetical protein n=1 Tax=Dysgonomonas sp. 521 TaxID=2302932 RepID=UPI0013D038F8|nr:hypothetical protein [Dysgonomonas sp. 521]